MELSMEVDVTITSFKMIQAACQQAILVLNYLLHHYSHQEFHNSAAFSFRRNFFFFILDPFQLKICFH